MERNFTDLVKIDGSAVRVFQTTDALVYRPGKRSLFMAEQFTLKQIFRNGGAIDLGEFFIVFSAKLEIRPS